METMRRISKRYYLRQIVIWLMVNLMFFGVPFGALALPTGGSVAAGSANISDIANMVVDGQAVINWGGFNTDAGEIVGFDGSTPGAMFAVLNRISGGATSFNGILNGNNGLVILSNPSGIIFGGSAFVQARSFAAVGFDITPGAFMAQGLNFDPLNFNYSGPSGDIYLKYEKIGGNWEAAEIRVNETLALIGRNIMNKGKIYTDQPGAYVVMAAGEEVMIGRENGKVMVDVSAPVPGNFVVDNGGFEGSYHGRIYAEGGHVVLAAGDIYSTAIEGVETLRATAVVKAKFKGDILAEATPGSDAVAEIEIKTGANLTIWEDIKAESTGNGVDDAIAKVTIVSDGQIDIRSDGPSGTTVGAKATDGKNNLAEVTIEAKGGDVRLLAPDRVTVKAEASGDCLEATSNVANVTVKGNNVEVRGQDGGETNKPAEIIAHAHHGQSNTANIDVEAENDVLVVGEGGEDDGQIIATAEYGDRNRAGVTINAGGNVEVLAKKGVAHDDGGASIIARAAYGCEGDAVLNEANVDIKADSVIVNDNSAGDSEDGAEIMAQATEGEENIAGVKIEAECDVLVTNEAGDADEAKILAEATNGDDNTATVDIDAGGNVKVKDYVKGGEGDHDDGPAYIKAVATDSKNSNTAQVDIEAGGNVVVLSKDGGEAKIEAYAGQSSNSENNANINILAKDGYVLVHAIGGAYNDGFNPSRASIEATAENAGGGTNSADITIVAKDVVVPSDIDDDADSDLDGEKDGDVMVLGVEGGKAEIEAKAIDGDDNSATVDIDAETDVKVMALCKDQPSEAEIMALAKDADNSNTANITIVAGEDVKVIAKDGGKAEIEAIAKDADLENTAGINIEAGDDVKVIAKGRKSDALIYALADPVEGDPINIAGITIVAGDDVKVIGEDGGEAGIVAEAEDGQTNTATVDIDAGDDVKVLGIGGDAMIEALAYNGMTNTAGVSIDAGDDVKVKAAGCEAAIRAEAKYGKENNASVALGGIGHKIGGDVEVIAERGDAYIEAKAHDGKTNDADVLICTEGQLLVQAGELCGEQQDGQKNAYVKAKAYNGFENTSSVGIGAEDGIAVMAFGDRSDASIVSKAKNGYRNEADFIACTGGDLWVLGINGGDAEIASEALHGYITDAYTATAATGDIIVAAADLRHNREQTFKEGNGFGGSSAKISAEAESKHSRCKETTANAEVHVVSKEGGVVVLAGSINCQGPEAKAAIESKASGAKYNSAYTGVASQGTVKSLPTLIDKDQSFGDALSDLLSGNVVVAALGNGEAKISSGAYGHRAIENDAMTVICAPGKVIVAGLFGGEAEVSSKAFGAEENSAQTKVYASKVALIGDGKLKAKTPGNYVSLDHMCITPEGKVAYDGEGDGSALVIIGNYANREDCPDCPPCPCEEQGALAAAAALAPAVFPQSQDCPLLVQAATAELTGTGEAEAIDIVMENALAVNPDINPCQACASLLDSAAVLADPDGSRMAALAAVVSSAVAPDQPFDPAAELMIASAIAENVDNPENPEFAFAGEFVDALVDYVAAAAELGIPAEDGRALVMAKYGGALESPENANVMAYVQARLAALQ